MAKSMMLKNVVSAFDERLKPELAQDWDNVGLLVGDGAQKISRVMMCIDLTPAVLREAEARRVQLAFAYHPPLFKAIKNVRCDEEPIVFRAIKSGVSIYSIHTALDVLDGGTSDVLADLVDLKNRRPMDKIADRNSKSKLVVFVPEKYVAKVANAIFAAGGGQIGNYDACSFSLEGVGTFRGNDESNPSFGRAGQFEMVDEVRLEIVIENSNLPEAMEAIKNSHPYETPAFDIYPLAMNNEKPMGLGRIGELGKPADLKSIVAKIKRRTKLKHLQVADGGVKKIKRIAVGPGACGDFIEPIADQIDLFITGEVRHHTALAAVRAGVSVICLGHGNSERITLPALKNMLSPMLPDLEFIISAHDQDPLYIV